MGGEGAQGVDLLYGGGGYAPLLALVDRGARGVQENQIQKYGTISMPMVFPYFKSN
jgi:hypothetical protein